MSSPVDYADSVATLWRGVARYPQAFKFLIAYTIYLDSALTFGTVITNLFNLSVRPSLIEFTAWNVVGSGTSIISATAFLLLFPRTRFTLRHWAIAALVIVTVICVWCLIGMSSAPIGFKHRVEFYIWQVLQSIAGGILTPLFRVLFSEVFPKGSEIQYFGFQMVVSLDQLQLLIKAIQRYCVDSSSYQWSNRRCDQQP